MASLGLYASMGFVVRDPIIALCAPHARSGPHVRDLAPEDLDACEALARATHGHPRTRELLGLHLAGMRPRVREVEGRLVPYQPRASHLSALHEILLDHHEKFECVHDERYSRRHGPLRPQVGDAFRRLLDRGVLAHGFSRVRCRSCGHEIQVPWSCRRMTLCPGCGQRRCIEFGTYVDEAVLEAVPYRPVVITMPRMLRQGGGTFLPWPPHLSGERLEELFRRKLLSLPLRRQRVSETTVGRLLIWSPTGFSAWVGAPIEPEQKESRQRLARYLVRYSSRSRGKRLRAHAQAEEGASDSSPSESSGVPPVVEKTLQSPAPGPLSRKAFRRFWAELLKRVWNIDALLCPKCHSGVHIVSAIHPRP